VHLNEMIPPAVLSASEQAAPIPGVARRLIRWLGLGPTLRSLRATRLIDTTELHALPERTHLARLLPLLGVDCVFDVGANEGQYGSMLRRGARYRGRIVSFEPSPEPAAVLRQASAGDPLWNIEELAIAPAAGRQTFNVMKSSAFSSLSVPRHEDVTIFRNQNVAIRRIEVETDTLANVYTRLKRQLGFKRPYLKLDTQGLDVDIVKSGRDIIHEFVGLQSELSMRRIYQDSVDFRQAISFYQDLGFELSALVPNNAGCFPILVEMDCIMVRADLLRQFS
jgi:FkbM family methyltransferase